MASLLVTITENRRPVPTESKEARKDMSPANLASSQLIAKAKLAILLL
jgi:hypothetical protein